MPQGLEGDGVKGDPQAAEGLPHVVKGGRLSGRTAQKLGGPVGGGGEEGRRPVTSHPEERSPQKPVTLGTGNIEPLSID